MTFDRAGAGAMKQAELFNVKGHVALVTGAASGLGLAYAEVMADNGATVVLADINEAELAKQVARLKAAGGAVEPAVVDVADTPALQAVIDGAAKRHGRLDVLFANAGISGGQGTLVNPAGAIDQFDVEAYKRAIDINLTATLMAMRFAVPHMKAAQVRQHRRHRLDRRHPRRADHRLWLHRVEGGGDQHRAAGGGRTRAVQHPRQRHRAGPVSHEHRRWPAASRAGRRQAVRRHGAARPAGADRRDQGAGAAAGVARRQLISPAQ